MEETQQRHSAGGLGQNWRLQRALNKNHSKWTPAGELAGKEGIGVRLWLSNHQQPHTGVSQASEGFLGSQLLSGQDENGTAHHVPGITADYPMCYCGVKNYKDILLFQLLKEALKG